MMLPWWSRSLQHFSRACLLRTGDVPPNYLGSFCHSGSTGPLLFQSRGYSGAAAAVVEDPDKNNLVKPTPCSLALPLDSPLRIEEPKFDGLKHLIFKMLLFYSKQRNSIRGANVVYIRVDSQVNKSHIYDVFNLEKTFKTTFSLVVLHMWLVLRRLKEEGKEDVELGQYLYEIYNLDVEMRVSKAGVNLMLTRWMKDLEKIFYGNIVAYDTAPLPEAKQDELSNVIWRSGVRLLRNLAVARGISISKAGQQSLQRSFRRCICSQPGVNLLKETFKGTSFYPPRRFSTSVSDGDGSKETEDFMHLKVPIGWPILEEAHANDIDLEGACEGSLSCSTCHVIVMDVDCYNKLAEPTDEENVMLDLAFGLTETYMSRLGCQLIARRELDGIWLAIPSATRNFAVDGFVPKPH